jgi:hypothetical protein
VSPTSSEAIDQRAVNVEVRRATWLATATFGGSSREVDHLEPVIDVADDVQDDPLTGERSQALARNRVVIAYLRWIYTPGVASSSAGL